MCVLWLTPIDLIKPDLVAMLHDKILHPQLRLSAGQFWLRHLEEVSRSRQPVRNSRVESPCLPAKVHR